MTPVALRSSAPAPDGATAIITVRGLHHRYGEREALRGVDLDIARGEIVALLGPNGGGKTTLFKVLATLAGVQEGSVHVLGVDLARDRTSVRSRLGVVFQNPGLDPKLTVRENLVHHGHLYGVAGRALRDRIESSLRQLDLAARADDLVETLSGGLARRAELARGLLHEPELLLLDEPSTGLDPGARREFFRHLLDLQTRRQVTIVLTTHFMEEAERADRVAVLDEGRLVAVGAPDELKRSVGGDVVVVHAEHPERVRDAVRVRFGVEAQLVNGTVRIERRRGHDLLRDLVEAFPAEIRSVSFGRPTLEDVFVHLTGRQFWSGDSDEAVR
ncbi:MAG: ATP-binding cassette domain-containing protein [Candidatus Binatia bacterium]